MKVIFLKDVPKLGKRDDVKDMNDGYVRNFLIPQKLVEIATTEALDKLKKKLSDRKAGNDAEDVRNRLGIEAVKDKEITIKAKANDKNALFKNIGPKDISAAIKNQFNMDISADMLPNDLHIKSLGAYSVKVTAGKHTGSIMVNIVRE